MVRDSGVSGQRCVTGAGASTLSGWKRSRCFNMFVVLLRYFIFALQCLHIAKVLSSALLCAFSKNPNDFQTLDVKPAGDIIFCSGGGLSCVAAFAIVLLNLSHVMRQSAITYPSLVLYCRLETRILLEHTTADYD